METSEILVDDFTVAYQGPQAVIYANLPPGNYSVTGTDSFNLTVVKEISITCEENCRQSSSLCIDIQPEPLAQFTTSPAADNGQITICQGQSIQFQNESAGSTSVIWDFGNGATTVATDPEYTYPEPGSFEVKLIARNDCYCADTTYLNVTVTDAQIPDIQCLGTVCEGDTATYTTSVNCNFYGWQISPGGTIIAGGTADDDFVTVAWADGPTAWVELQALACSGSVCTDPVRQAVSIIPSFLFAEGPQEVCPHQIAQYSVPDFGATDFQWNIPSSHATILSGQGTHEITVEFGEFSGNGNPQNILIEVEFENCFLGCSGQGSASVQLKQPSYISGPLEICQGGSPVFEVELVGSSGNGSGLWEIVDSVGTVVWQSGSSASQISPTWDFPAGNYTVQLVATGNADCSEGSGLGVALLSPPPPVGGITGEGFVCPQGWYNYAVEDGQQGAVFSWQIENGESTTEKTGPSVNVQWGDLPPYRLTVFQTTATGLYCPSEPLVLDVKKLPAPEIEGPSEACRSTSSTYTIEESEGIDYQWFITPASAGAISAGQGTGSVTVFWQTPGAAVLSLAACGETVPHEVNVGAVWPPVVGAPMSLCPGETATVSTSDLAENYAWKNGSGQALGTGMSIELGPGFYALEVADAQGCAAQTNFQIAEKSAPEAFISTPNNRICPQGETVTLFSLDTQDGLSFTWSSGSSPVGTDSPILEVADTGTYSLTVTSSEGCTDMAYFTVEGCPTGGGGGGAGGNPPGGGNCTPTDLTANVDASGDCPTQQFSTPTAIAPGSANWFFFDGTGTVIGSVDGADVTFTFPTAGHFNYRLNALVPDADDPTATCPNTAFGTTTVPLKASFSAIETCPGLPTSFTDESSFLPGTGIASWAWDFGDPGSGADNFSTAQHPAHVFQSSGNYTVSLTVESAEGCISVFTKNIQPHGAPAVSFAPPAANCSASSVAFEGEISAGAVAIHWDFGDPGSGEGNFSQSENPWHSYPGAAEYEVSLSASNIYGCENTFTQTVDVISNNLGGEIFPADPAPTCEGLTLGLTAPAAPLGSMVAYSWSDGSTGNAINVSESGVYKVTLTDDFGCTYTTEAVGVEVIPGPDATIRALELNAFGQPVAYSEGGFSACEGEDVFLEMVGLPKYTYLWSDGSTGEQLTLAEATGNILPTGSHTFTVTVTDTETGCTAVEGPFPVTIHGAPAGVEIGSNPEGPICDGTEAMFFVVSPDADLGYQWNTGQSGTEMTAVAAGTYLVQATNIYGCTANSEATEIHHAPPLGSLPMGCFSFCEPTEICLPEMPEVAEIQWFINGEEVPAPEGNAAVWTTGQSGDYAVHLTSIYGCETYADGLSIDIASQMGDLFGKVYLDMDGDGLINPTVDSLLPGAYVEIWQGSLQYGFQITDETGGYFYENFAVGEYELVLNISPFPAYEIVGEGMAEINLTGCSTNAGLDFLVMDMCAQPVTASLELMACPGGSASFGGVDLPVGASQIFNLTSAQGCDSILTVSVGELSTSMGETTLSACPGGTAEYLGVAIPAGGSEVFVLENYTGCDSTLTVSVGELSTSMGELEIFTCPGTPTEYNGQPLWPGDEAVFILENHVGCDSTLTVNVSSSETDTTYLQLSVCAGESVDYQGVLLSQNESATVTLTSVGGCDSTVVATVAALPPVEFSTSTGDICHGTAEGLITVEISSGTPPFTCSLDGVNFQTKPDFADLPGGNYTIYVKDDRGCLGEEEIRIRELPPLRVITDDYVLPCDEEEVVLRPIVTSYVGELKWRWEDGSQSYFRPVSEAGMYRFEVEDDCAVEERMVQVDWGDNVPENFLYIPNAFSPNGDQINDEFRAYVPQGADVQSFEMRVFNRWGGEQFVSFDPEEGWDGEFQHNPQGVGVYVWYVRATVEICGIWQEVFMEGDVVLMR